MSQNNETAAMLLSQANPRLTLPLYLATYCGQFISFSVRLFNFLRLAEQEHSYDYPSILVKTFFPFFSVIIYASYETGPPRLVQSTTCV